MPMNIDDNNDGGASGGLAAFQRLVTAGAGQYVG